jgi:transglutaminase-like putative cysteine protease/tetratricopeptide (TPR) repeat protein
MHNCFRALALSFVFAVSVSAAEVWDGAPFASDPKALLAAAEAVKPGKPEHGVVVLLDEESVTFDEKGLSTRVERLIYRVVDESAVDGWDTIETGWSPWYHEKPVVDARVISKDGAVHRLDPRSFGTEDADDEPAMFTDTRVLSGPLPAVAPGSVIEQLITWRERNPLYEAGVSARHQFGRWVETRQARLIIDYPSALAVKLVNHTQPAIQPRRTEENGRTRLVFETGVIPAVERREWNLPHDVNVTSYVGWATGKSWQAVATRYSQIIDEKIGDGSSVAKLTATTVGDAKDPKEIAARILAAVERHIRYAGVEFGEGSIIPRTPAETLKNKYGDCKDKATLLVAMLRQAGVKAHAVLIRAGAGFDVEPELPGLGHFNHVIVVTEGPNPIWIDPTDEFARAGELPDSDQGRLVLIAKNDTTALVRTPADESSANRTSELREFRLVEDGKAFVIETSEYSGSDERSTRRYYTSNDKKALGDGLKTYAEQAYLAKKLAKWEAGDTRDLTKPFRLHIEMQEATRGLTGGGEAAVGIFLSRLVGDMPAEFHRDTEEENEETPEDEKYRPRVNDYFFAKPYVLDMRYRIVPPPGYVVRNLPETETLKLATATLTKSYKVQDDGVLLAEYRFDSGPRRITAAQYEALRKEVVKIAKEKALLLYFDQLGKRHLDAGEVGKAVAEYRRLSQLHPKEALHHTEVARALLAGGMGAAARREAKKAIEVEPQSAKAHATLGWVLANDLIGRELRSGCDVAGSIAAYRKAKELKKDDLTIRAELAMILQHTDSGVRYGDVKRMGESIDEYVAMKKDIEDADDAAIDRELMPLYAHSQRWDELKILIAATTDTQAKDVWSLVATAVADGAPAAIAAAGRMEPSKRREIQSQAGNTLVVLRHYTAAADLLIAAAQGAPNAAALRQQADLVRKATRHEQLQLDPADAKSVLRNAFLDVFKGATVEELKKYATTDAAAIFNEEGLRQNGIQRTTPRRRATKKALQNKDITAKLMADLALSAIDIQQDGDEPIGYRLRGRAPSGGQGDFTAYVVKENGAYRLAGFDSAPSGLALRAFRLAEKNDVAGAKHWLDWAREHVSGGGDDPVASEPFAALWTRGREATADEIRLAAAVLLPDTKKSSELALPVLETARATASPETQWRIDQALLSAYFATERWTDALATADRLTERFPDSGYAFRLAYISLSKLKRDDEAKKRALARLQKFPGDMSALQILGEQALEKGSYEEASRYFAGVLERTGAGAGDYNQRAWTAIFAKQDLEAAIDEARHAVAKAPESYAILNTLAVLYAEQGKSSEAREALLQSVEKHEEDELEDADWYVVGRIAENYGITDAAVEAYQKIEKPKEALGGTTWELAQGRLRTLRR